MSDFVVTIRETELTEGKMRAVRIKGNPVLLARVGGQVYAVSNWCPHEGCSFHSGILTGFIVMCPCHGWKFDVRNGKPQQNPSTSLESYQCKVQNGKIQVETKKKN